MRLLRGCLSPYVGSESDVGWEERVEAGMTHLLRTHLARNAKEASTVPVPLAPLTDTQKLKRHVSIVVERIARGGRLFGTRAKSQ